VETPDVHKVERILRKRRRGGQLEYLCRWEGYGAERTTLGSRERTWLTI
jgi:hypothetical protein